MKKLIIILFFFPVLTFGQITGFFNQSNAAPTGGGGHDTDVEAWVDQIVIYGGTSPSESVLNKLDLVVDTLKTDGIWAKLDGLYIYLNDGSIESCLVNMANPGTLDATSFGSPDWVSGSGVLARKSSTTQGHFDLNNEESNLTYWDQNGHSFGIVTDTLIPGQTAFLFGAYNSSYMHVIYFAGASILGRSGDAYASAISTNYSYPVFIMNRTDSNTATLYVNSDDDGPTLEQSEPKDIADNVGCMALNSSGGILALNAGDFRIQAVFFGGDLTVSQVETITDVLRNYCLNY
jgi:hypothetical protein